MGLFKKKNAFVVADYIDCMPEFFFRTAKGEYCLGMKVSQLAPEFTFAEMWQAKEKLKPKECVTVKFLHKETGGKLEFHLVNRGKEKCRYQDAELRGVSAGYAYSLLDRTLLQFCYKLSNCNKCLDGCSTPFEVRSLLGKSTHVIEEQECVEKVKMRSTTPRIEYIEQEYDDMYYTIKTKVYDTQVEEFHTYVGEQEIWRRGGVCIEVCYSAGRSNLAENITVTTTR